jgi:hypothetical protein
LTKGGRGQSQKAVHSKGAGGGALEKKIEKALPWGKDRVLYPHKIACEIRSIVFRPICSSLGSSFKEHAGR